jgi:hypothetical protein
MSNLAVVSLSPADPTAWLVNAFFGGSQDALLQAWHAGDHAAFRFASVILRVEKLPIKPLDQHIPAIAADGDVTFVAGTLSEWYAVAHDEAAMGKKAGQLALNALRGVAPRLFGFGAAADKRVSVVTGLDGIPAALLPAVVRPVMQTRVGRQTLERLRAEPHVSLHVLPLDADRSPSIAGLPALEDHAQERVRRAYATYATAVAKFAETVRGQVDEAVLERVLPDVVETEVLLSAPISELARLASADESLASLHAAAHLAAETGLQTSTTPKA